MICRSHQRGGFLRFGSVAVLVAVEEILVAALPPAAPRQAEHVRAARSQSLFFDCSQSHVAVAPAHLIVDRASAESAYRLLGLAGPSKPVEVAANAVFEEPQFRPNGE